MTATLIRPEPISRPIVIFFLPNKAMGTFGGRLANHAAEMMPARSGTSSGRKAKRRNCRPSEDFSIHFKRGCLPNHLACTYIRQTIITTQVHRALWPRVRSLVPNTRPDGADGNNELAGVG